MHSNTLDVLPVLIGSPEITEVGENNLALMKMWIPYKLNLATRRGKRQTEGEQNSEQVKVFHGFSSVAYEFCDCGRQRDYETYGNNGTNRSLKTFCLFRYLLFPYVS